MLHRVALTAIALGGLLGAQTAPKAAGHWEGALKAPNQNVPVTVDLAKNQKGEWIGSMSMPAQGARDIPISGISVTESSVRFSMLDAPGAPVLDCRLAADGASMSGSFSAGGQSIPVELKRTGEADVKAPPPSTELAKAFEGTWEGTLEGGPQALHLVVKLGRGPDGKAKGDLTSVDQGNVVIPISTITQKDKSLTFEVRAINGTYTGTLSADGSQIEGQWSQGGGVTPLVLKKKA